MTELSRSLVPDDAAGEPRDINTQVAHPARVYDYWLGGKDNFAADREAGEQAVKAYPDLVIAVRANRAFLGRAVRYLVNEAGIRQFLDIGTGIPTANNTHEVAQSAAPESRIVYADNDPMVLAHSRALLRSSPQGATAYIEADLRDVAKILDEAASTLDFSQPIGVMLVAVLQYIPDEDDPYQIVSQLMAAVPPGSHLVVSHPARDINAEQVAESMRRYNERAFERATPRTHAEVARFFAGLELVPPGLVPIPEWRPENAVPGTASIAMWGGAGRKE
ncbi:MAG TPA: SAM-dependent methyltransferase [Trebonia sp.]|jgi:O-methyltransferase involved in polyketide biosynthesis|nr:SAM-dependent methyltransferase [Trebonia sp.]